MQLRMIKRRRWFHFLLGKAWRLRRRISVKCRTLDVAGTRPESRANHFMRIGLAGNGICSRAFRSAPSREACHAEIEASPKKMHRTVFANETGTTFLKDVLAEDQDLPEAVCIFGIVRSVLRVALEPHRVRHLTWHGPEIHCNAQRPQGRHEFRIEVCDRLRLQCQNLRRAPTGLDDQPVLDEVELKFETPVTVMDCRSR